MIKTFIFDIGNVVLHFDHEKMVRQLAETLGVPFTLIKTRLFDEDMLRLFELGSLTTDHLIEQMLKLSPLKPSKTEFLNSWNNIFKENETLTPILRSLRHQEKKLILLSNISEAHFEYVSHAFPNLQLFDCAVLSYKEHHAKPEKEIYEAVLSLAGCQPHECFYTDDILGHVIGARQLNIDAEVFDSAEELRQQLARRMIFV